MKSTNKNIKKNHILKIILFVLVLVIIATGLVFVVSKRIPDSPINNDGVSDTNLMNQDDISEDNAAEGSDTLVEDNSTSEDTDSEAIEVSKAEMLPEMEILYNENPDIIAWVTIEDTRIDYPIVFTPEDEEKYLHRGFDGSYDIKGVPFLDADCDIYPESTNLIIYGHNMAAGTMFHDLLKYEDEEFWKEHPTFEVKTLYETRTYEIIGAFRDKVYFAYEDCFKFYKFIDPTEEEFDEAIAYFIEKTPYDMNVSAEYGDNFITLVTCAAHQQFGRYVVIAREIKD